MRNKNSLFDVMNATLLSDHGYHPIDISQTTYFSTISLVSTFLILKQRYESERDH